MKKVRFCGWGIVFLLCFSIASRAQQPALSPPARAITNVTIHTADGQTIESGSIIWRNGVIEAAGADVAIPFDAYVIDGGDSLHVYPGFIDGLALWGSPDRPEVERPDQPGNPGYARAGIQPQRKPHELLTESEAFEKAQKLGFTTAALSLTGEMLPGQVELFFLNGDNTGENLYKTGVGILAQFEGARGRAYPSTTMGVMAQFRQLWYDADALMTHINYYQEASSGYPAPDHSKVLEALFPVMNNEQPFYFVVDSKEYIERMLWLKEEFGFDVILVSGEAASEKADLLQEQNIPVLASFDLPEEPEWRTEQEGEEEEPEVSQEEISEIERIFRERQLEAYQTDIENIQNLVEAGVKVGYISNGMELDDFRKKLKTLNEETDLTADQILQILTQNTADILGVGNRLGDIEQGRIASFSVFTRPYLDEDTQVYYSVSNGNLTKFEVEPKSDDSDENEEE